MTVVTHLVVVVHLLGMAALVGGWLALRLSPESNRLLALLVWGARMQVITGIILVGLLMATGDPINHMKIGIKFLIAVAAAACAEIAGGRARRGQPNIQALRDGAGLAGVLNMLVAVLWT